MNYIKQLNAAFEKFYFDDRLNPTHISLYMALFQEWNSNRFAKDFYVNRRDLMRIAKIGSKSTYHRCVTDLNSWEYLCYFPSNNPFKGSKIKMFIFGTSDKPDEGQYDPTLEQIAEHYHLIDKSEIGRHPPDYEQEVYSERPTSGQALVSNINNNKPIKHTKHPNSLKEVLEFFNNKNCNPEYAKKFFEYYEARHWQTSDGTKIRDWRALAQHWVEKNSLMRKKRNLHNPQESQFRDNLRTTKNKDYGQPL